MLKTVKIASLFVLIASVHFCLGKDEKVIRNIGWQDGKVREFQTAYTLQRHEFKLNVIGPSSFAFTNRFQLSSYLCFPLFPNLQFKYKFVDKGPIAAAYEVGIGAGALPVAAFGGIVLPGGALGGGTIGAITASDLSFKMYLSWKPTKAFTLSLRGGISSIHSRYFGLGGFGAIGGGGAGVGFFPIDVSVISLRWYMAGIEADYVINARNAIVLKSSLNHPIFTGVGNKNERYNPNVNIIAPTLTWVHTIKQHLHLMAGMYGYLDPPRNFMTTNGRFPFAPYANVYWILHNRIKKQ